MKKKKRTKNTDPNPTLMKRLWYTDSHVNCDSNPSVLKVNSQVRSIKDIKRIVHSVFPRDVSVKKKGDLLGGDERVDACARLVVLLITRVDVLFVASDGNLVGTQVRGP